MSHQLPAEIAEAIEAYGKAAYAQGYFGDSDHEGAGPEVKARRAALDAVILKHLSNAAEHLRVTQACCRAEKKLREAAEIENTALKAERMNLATDLGRAALAEDGRG